MANFRHVLALLHRPLDERSDPAHVDLVPHVHHAQDLQGQPEAGVSKTNPHFLNCFCLKFEFQIDEALAPLKAKLSEVMDKAKTSMGGASAKKEE